MGVTLQFENFESYSEVDYLDQLSEVQKDAVTTSKGPSLIIAGAGSGKTRVLTFRIAHLLQQGVAPWSILALTFTNKAAKEMKERIAGVVGESTAKQLWMGTFHSMFMRILRQEGEKLGYPKTFTIYDTYDSKNLVSSIIKELKLDTQTYKVGEVYGKISSAKNNLITPQAYAANTNLVAYDRQTRKPEVARIYSMYAQRCYKSAAMDFDDLLLNTNILFRDFPEVLAKYQDKFKYILVDEYQDTNYSQYLIVKKLAASHKNVCVVGDDAQSIYSFRGAKIENILNFRNDYPDYKLFKLEQNYRSTQTIVNAANSVIAKNSKQLQKVAYSANSVGEKIKIIRAYNDHEEGFLIASAILDALRNDPIDYKEFAILYRTNAQSRIFEEALRKRNIPYRVYGSLSFYQRKEVKDIIAYFRLAINPHDDEALKRVVNYPARGIGNTTMERVAAEANRTNQSLWTTIEKLGSVNPGLKPAAIKKLSEFLSMIRHFANLVFTNDAYEAAYAIAKESGIIRELKADSSFEGIARLQNTEELLNGISEFIENQKSEGINETITLADFLENVSLLTDADTDKPEDRNKVNIMTIHSAKGLEFSYVFLAGVEEDLFPSRMTVGSPDELEEERRLFYVALTRAAKAATISYAQVRHKWGTLTNCVPSRFINEIDSEWIENTSPQEADDPTESPESKILQQRGTMQRDRFFSGSREKDSYSKQRNLESKGFRKVTPESNSQLQANFTHNPASLASGVKVLHDRFGVGTVIEIDGEGQNQKATILFSAAGKKCLLVKFAKLKIIE
ncbi:MAG TPA: 3'-5' exonuclease [Tenuifilaceae bacterium]|nr:3'-5' exonuclease [Tenuifilaceae bacterium]HPJ45309.1 3'-5' exonuclease [Tenuifilaceae bacterium]HPQ33656.1 3'-5' exonuclease [Tenuifilaceae bacterium]HRX67278.1 3'-5' exonuclease [Tenuifilaceae bacterium]